jgi:hypothetical protein
MKYSIHLSAVKVLRTGADGGHIYIKGQGIVPGHGDCDVYAYFRSRQEEREFEDQFSGQEVVIGARAIEFTQGIGCAVREVLSWSFIESSR